jgi:outer membrane protein OmpA-like peptidoglycan-associated protein
MLMTKKHGLILFALLAGGVLLAAQSLVGCCGEMVFSDSSTLNIAGTPPAPPPPPPPPPPEPKRVEVTADKIVIKDKILFDFNKSTIKAESHDLLNEIVDVIKANPRIRRLSIEGHTDSDGSDKYNQKLSEGRAAAVKAYLVEKGIDEGMLDSKGHGESKPIADNETDEGKEKNRRVEFLITAQDEVKEVYEVDPKTGKKQLVKKAEKAEKKAGKAEEKAEKKEGQK